MSIAKTPGGTTREKIHNILSNYDEHSQDTDLMHLDLNPVAGSTLMYLSEACINGQREANFLLENCGYKFAGNNFIAIGSPDRSIPAQFFLATNELIEKINMGKDGEYFSGEEVYAMCIEETKNAVSAKFGFDALNQINAAYYSHPNAFEEETYTDGFFSDNAVVNIALGEEIKKRIQKDEIRFEELSTGSRFPRRWQYLSKLMPEAKITALLTDFPGATPPNVQQINADTNYPNVELSTGEYSLLDNMAELPAKKKIDIMMAFYSFDSISFPEDARYIKQREQWYRCKFRVKVQDNSIYKTELLEALTSGKMPKNLPFKAFQDIFIEEVVEKIDITKVPYSKFIQSRASHNDVVELNFPGGIVEKVKEAFYTRIGDDGMFIIGDVTVGGISHYLDAHKKPPLITGLAGRYKLDDYVVAKEILEAEGFKVDLLSAADFVEQTLGFNFHSKIDKITEHFREKFGSELTDGNISQKTLDHVSNNLNTRIMIVQRA